MVPDIHEGHTPPDTDEHANPNSDCDVYTDSHTYCEQYCHVDLHPDAHTDTNIHPDDHPVAHRHIDGHFVTVTNRDCDHYIHIDCHAYTYNYTIADRNIDSYCHTHTYRHSHFDAHTYGYADLHPDSDGKQDTHGDIYHYTSKCNTVIHPDDHPVADCRVDLHFVTVAHRDRNHNIDCHAHPYDHPVTDCHVDCHHHTHTYFDEHGHLNTYTYRNPYTDIHVHTNGHPIIRPGCPHPGLSQEWYKSVLVGIFEMEFGIWSNVLQHPDFQAIHIYHPDGQCHHRPTLVLCLPIERHVLLEGESIQQ